jgi:hypothetical protein
MALTKALGGGGGATITTKDEGSTLSSSVTTLDFVGAGVTASGAGATTTITIAGAPSAKSVRLRNSGNQALNNGSLTTLSFDTEDYDTDGMHDGGNPTRITIVTAGTYVISGGFAATASATSVFFALNIVKNNLTTIKAVGRLGNGTGLGFDMEISTHDRAIVGDYYELKAFTNSATRNSLAQANYSPVFEAAFVGT